MSGWTRLTPWIASALGLAMVAAPAMRHANAGNMDLSEFARLPVVDGGRVKPLDTVARTNLMVISSRQSYDRSATETGRPAIEWMLDVMAARDLRSDPAESAAAKLRVFRIESLEILGLLKLEPRPGSYRYSWAELDKNLPDLRRRIEKAREAVKKDAKTAEPEDLQYVELGKHLSAYNQLAAWSEPLVVPPPTPDSEQWRSLNDVDEEIVTAMDPQAREAARSQAVDFVARMLEENRANLEAMGEEGRQRVNAMVSRYAQILLLDQAGQLRATVNPAAGAFADILAARKANDPAKFATAVDAYKQATADRISPDAAQKARVEVAFNAAAPFISCSGLYVIAFLLAAASWVIFPEPLRRAALGLTVTTLLVHTAALLVRMYLLDRPLVFVTNLYSSAVFIGWAAVVLGLAVEWAFGRGLGTAVAAMMGFASLLIAHFLGMDGDTLQMMQAVLDTNFWLATHVTVVTLGYAATYFAGFFAIAYIVWVSVLDRADAATARGLAGVVYGVVCFATLASFVGTVLGGIWADQSWGRFWGWDPKENGAVLIVIWNALILHARWGGMVKSRGVAVLAVLGCIVTTWSWFGTNQLGVGLHAYGFRSGMAATIVATSIAFLTIAAVGMVPGSVWQSLGFRPDPQAAKPSGKLRPGRA